jgi:hypothetical protein
MTEHLNIPNEDLRVPVCVALTVEELLAAIEADLLRLQQARQKVQEEALLTPVVVTIYRRQEERLRTAREVIGLYLEIYEEACMVDADDPLPIEVTPTGLAYVAALGR